MQVVALEVAGSNPVIHPNKMATRSLGGRLWGSTVVAKPTEEERRGYAFSQFSICRPGDDRKGERAVLSEVVASLREHGRIPPHHRGEGVGVEQCSRQGYLRMGVSEERPVTRHLFNLVD